MGGCVLFNRYVVNDVEEQKYVVPLFNPSQILSGVI
jgi:hypothetical protein